MLEEIKALRKSLVPTDEEENAASDAKSQLNEEQELARLNDDYWFHKQHTWLLKVGYSLPALARAFEAHQKPDHFVSFSIVVCGWVKNSVKR